MSLRIALNILQVLTISAQIYMLYWYKTSKIHYCEKCVESHDPAGNQCINSMEKFADDHV